MNNALCVCFCQVPKKQKRAHKELLRSLFHWVLRQVVDNIEEMRHGFHFVFPNGQSRWLVPVLALVITDWPEGQAMSLVGGAAMASKFNCRHCLHPRNEMAFTSDGVTYPKRSQVESMQLKEQYAHVKVKTTTYYSSITKALLVYYVFIINQ